MWYCVCVCVCVGGGGGVGVGVCVCIQEYIAIDHRYMWTYVVYVCNYVWCKL